MNDKLAILVGGGPAPGINSVIGAATIRAALSGVEVLGVQEGYKWLIEGDLTRVTPLTIADTSRIHFRGGSTLGISRANPTKSPAMLAKCLDTLNTLGVGMPIPSRSVMIAARASVASGSEPAIRKMSSVTFAPRPVIDNPPTTSPAAAQAATTGMTRVVVSARMS